MKALISKRKSQIVGLFSIRGRIFLRGQGIMSRAHVREARRQGMRMWRLGSEVDATWVCQGENGQRGRKDDDFAVIGST